MSVKKGIKRVGKGASHSYFLLVYYVFHPQEKKKRQNKIVLQARYSQEENFAPKAGMTLSSQKD